MKLKEKTEINWKQHIKNINKTDVNNLDEEIKALYIKDIDEKNIDYKKYGKNYNEKDFWSKVRNVGQKIGAKPLYAVFSLYYAIPKVSLLDKTIIIGSLGYLISPFDLIPDFIPVIGLMDDIGVLTWAFYRISANARNIDDEVKGKTRNKLKEIFPNMSEEEINRLL